MHSQAVLPLGSLCADIEIRRKRRAAAFELSPDGIACVDEHSRLAEINTTACTLFGLSSTDTLGQPESEFINRIATKLQPHDEARLREFLSGRVSTNTIDLPLGHKPGVRAVRLHIRPYGVKPAERIYFFHDITQELQARLERNDFLSAAAHELRTPLSTVKGYASMLAREKLDSDRKLRIARLIERQTDRLGKLVNALMDLSQLDARGAQGLRRERVNMLDVISDALDAIGPERGERVDVRLPPSEALLLDGEHDKLVQVLINLLDNALKYSAVATTVTVQLEVDDSNPSRRLLQLSIADSGEGINPADEARAFERFFRAPKHQNLPGSGLGLSLVKSIVEMHGGFVRLHSREGAGTVLKVTFPAAIDS